MSGLVQRQSAYGGVSPLENSRVVGEVGDQRRSLGSGRMPPQCNDCRKMHSGECKRGNRGCYICGRMGHFEERLS